MDSGVGLVRASIIFLMKYGELGGEKIVCVRVEAAFGRSQSGGPTSS